jgi:hypothetical protein
MAGLVRLVPAISIIEARPPPIVLRRRAPMIEIAGTSPAKTPPGGVDLIGTTL